MREVADQQQLFQHFRLDNLGTSGIQPRSGYFHLFPTPKHHLSGHKFARKMMWKQLLWG